MAHRRRKTGALALGVTGLLASAMVTGCTPSGDVIDADYAKVCQDRKTEQRVEDSNCSNQGRSGGYYGWYFYSTNGHTVPAVGSKLTGGSTTAPKSGSVKSGVSSKGGTVSRGGFGTSAKGSSGG
jgi:hypothetical protein